MASQNTPKTLTSLEFIDIKNSLINYLKQQSIFSGYEFEGSALSTLMDLLAYNSYYYAFYSNMIASEAFLDSAQRIESLISLSKPLGYTVPSKTAAKAKVIVTGATDPTIAKYSVFYGYDSDGGQYRFYNLQDIPVADSQTEPFFIYEAKSVVDVEAINQLDVERQRIVFADTDFDLETLEVKILNPLTNGYEIWSRIDNIGYSNTVEEQIYFVERIETGFIISFGLINSVGKDVTSDIRSIKVTYLKSNGAKGNNINLFSSSFGNVITDGNPSAGGRNEPSLDTIKFLAPKWFAAQERAVTVNDYKALLMEAGFFSNENQFNVYGGEDIFPRRYGRVFVTSEKLSSDATDMMEFIKQRSVITVVPEYVNSIPLNVFVSFKFGFNDGVSRSASAKQAYITSIKSLFTEKYGSGRRYNLYFSASEFIDYVNSYYPEISMSIDEFNLSVEQEIDASITDYSFNLQNEIDLPLGQLLALSDVFNNNITNEPSLYVVENILASQTEIPIEVWSSDLTTKISSNAGLINIKSGYLNIKSKIMPEKLKFTIPFKQKTIRIGLNNLVSFSIKEITVV